jgi:hypothetical protein
MDDDKNSIKRPTAHQGAPRSSGATLGFRQYCLLDEAKRMKVKNIATVKQIMTQVDLLTKKVLREPNPRKRDQHMAQQSQALAYLALYLSKSK